MSDPPAQRYALDAAPSRLAPGAADESPGPAPGTTTVSIVSHRQRELAGRLLADLARLRPTGVARVVLTLNVPEAPPEPLRGAPFEVLVLRNERPCGFGANHNRAFHHCATPWFAILNPDLRLNSDVFASVPGNAAADEALLSPRILEDDGRLADASRRLLTPLQLLARLSGRRNPAMAGQVDWLAGMCLFVRSSAFAAVGGFDERFYLYLEDADLCLRLQLAGWRIRQVETASVVHAAQRASRHSLRHQRWHVASLAKHWLSAAFWRYLSARGRPR